MTYEIKLEGAEQDDGKIELHRLSLLAQAITEIAKGALQLRLMGISAEKGRTSDRITNALKIKLADLKNGSIGFDVIDKKSGSTILELECEYFKETLAGQQGDTFRPEILGDLPNQSPMTLVIEAFKEALNYKEEVNHLDKALLKKLKNFEKSLYPKKNY